MANERYGLQIMEPYLPGGNMDQRFDLIDIVKDFECELSGQTVYFASHW